MMLRNQNPIRTKAMTDLAQYLDGMLNLMDVETSQIGGG